MASALSFTAWMTASTSLLLTARIASRSLMSARPISSSLVVTRSTVRIDRSDGQLRWDRVVCGFVVVRTGLAVAGRPSQDQRIADDGDRREDEPLDRVAEVRSLVEHGFGQHLGFWA